MFQNATIPAPAEQKKPKKDDRNKRDDKNLEQFMKTLNPIATVDEKLALVCKKYVQSADEIKKMTFYIKQSDKRHALVVKEKEQLRLEFNKTVLVKSKLENLCRELQKQNKAIKVSSSSYHYTELPLTRGSASMYVYCHGRIFHAKFS